MSRIEQNFQAINPITSSIKQRSSFIVFSFPFQLKKSRFVYYRKACHSTIVPSQINTNNHVHSFFNFSDRSCAGMEGEEPGWFIGSVCSCLVPRSRNQICGGIHGSLFLPKIKSTQFFWVIVKFIDFLKFDFRVEIPNVTMFFSCPKKRRMHDNE